MSNLATNFSEDMLEKINNVLKFVLENEHSDFYRQKYGQADFYPLKSFDDFQKIPLLTKEDILSVGPRERLFLPENEISHYSLSSGTTNKKRLTVVAHSSLYDNTNFREDKIKIAGCNRVLILMPPTSIVFYKAITFKGDGVKMLSGDIHNLPLSANISSEIEANGIMTTATILSLFIPELEKINFPLENIRWISLGGEFCSTKKLEYFKSYFPNATIVFRFGTSEIGPRGHRCENLAQKNPGIFHPIKDSLVEILDHAEKMLPLESSGEIIHTDLTIKAFPLIRYKTRDIGSLAKENCDCGMLHNLTLGGRSGTDVLKFSGTTLYVQSIEDSLGDFWNYFEPKFQMHVFEEVIDSKIKTQLEIHLKLKPQFDQQKNQPEFTEKLSAQISHNLRLSKNHTLKQLIEKEVLLPLKIKFLDSFPEDHGKTKHIISHLS